MEVFKTKCRGCHVEMVSPRQAFALCRRCEHYVTVDGCDCDICIDVGIELLEAIRDHANAESAGVS